MGLKAMPKEQSTMRVKAGTSKPAAAARRVTFAHAYIANGRNATQAAKTAGFNPRSAHVRGRELVKDSNVSALIAEELAQLSKITELQTKRVLLETARLCFSDPRKLYRDDGSLKGPNEWDDDIAATVESFKIDETVVDGLVVSRTIKVKLWDKVAALATAMKHLGLYERDNHQHGPDLNLQVVLVGPP
jgi:phage terminase small subunit